MGAKIIVRYAADIFKKLTPAIPTAYIASGFRRSVGEAIMLYVISNWALFGAGRGGAVEHLDSYYPPTPSSYTSVALGGAGGNIGRVATSCGYMR